MKILGYARKQDLGPLLDEAQPEGSYITIGLDHPTLWVEDTPYEHLTPVYLAEFNEDECRTDFEAMAAICYPGALSAGRNEVHGTYINSNLEKRWKGWLQCDQFRAGIIPTQQRGKS